MNESIIAHDVPDWNRLSINEDDEQFKELGPKHKITTKTH